MSDYTLFVDESGDAGIERVRDDTQSGATPYFVFGATLIKNDTYEELSNVITDISSSFKTDFLHCNRLNHAQKKYFARTIARQPIMLFGLISRKSTLGGYKEYIDADVMRFHNKCAGYLLECVGEYLASQGIEPNDVDILFEKGPFDYKGLGNYVRYCQANAYYPGNKLLRNIAARKIRAVTKEDEPLFQISDLVAHALFRAVDINDSFFNIPEPQYFIELHKRFYHHPDTKELYNYGFKVIDGLERAQVPDEVKELLNDFRGESLFEV
ncbi:DUF3800 domain-containing protein [Kiloniella sp.]|uniref:DUF3800 domain-containing protein n=1 Tax=Kiloniella sp. TaxID=1938587 RepID=UPI003A8E99DE